METSGTTGENTQYSPGGKVSSSDNQVGRNAQVNLFTSLHGAIHVPHKRNASVVI